MKEGSKLTSGRNEVAMWEMEMGWGLEEGGLVSHSGPRQMRDSFGFLESVPFSPLESG